MWRGCRRGGGRLHILGDRRLAAGDEQVVEALALRLVPRGHEDLEARLHQALAQPVVGAGDLLGADAVGVEGDDHLLEQGVLEEGAADVRGFGVGDPHAG